MNETLHGVLIVEDSPTQREMLRHLLEKNAFRVEAADNGREALTLLKRAVPFPIAVITDIDMPEMDGYTLCREIKADPALHTIPVILLTSLSDPENVIMGLECGADDFIMKPYNEDFLLSRIQHILANRLLGSGEQHQDGQPISFRGRNYVITSDRLQVLNLLLSTYETAIQKNRELAEATGKLSELNDQQEVNIAELEVKNLQLHALNTELETQREMANEAKHQAEEANRAKSDFLANMSHELRTPLNSVIGFSEVLLDRIVGPINEKQQEYISNILGSGKHQLSLINDILDLSKVESGRMELESSVFSFRESLDTALAMLAEKAVQGGIELHLELAPQADIPIRGDRRKLKQIMYNLLSNAIKFTPKGGTVSIDARRVSGQCPEVAGADPAAEAPLLVSDADFIQVSVADTGIGIREEDIPRIFKAFVQLESVYTKEYEGSGLGLALTRQMVELHGGRIRVDSRFGMGSTFSFTIPVALPVAAAGQ
jgi:signal transduction histidine kinase